MKVYTKQELEQWIKNQDGREVVTKNEALQLAEQVLYWMRVSNDLQIIINYEKEGVTSLS